MPKKYTFLAFTNPVAGKEDAYNKWYDEHHLIDVINVPGFVFQGNAFEFSASASGPEPMTAW